VLYFVSLFAKWRYRMTYDLVGIGNALVDLEIQVEDHFIEKYSLVKGGMTLSTQKDQQAILDALSGHQAEKIVSGGSAANTLHGVSVLGGKAYYLGRVANDDFGRHYTEDMKVCEVGFPGPDSVDQGTGTCVVLVTPDTQRTMITHLGISAQLHAGNIDPTIVSNSKMVYIEGYLWTSDEIRSAGLKMAEIAKNNGIPVAFTLSDAFVVNSFKDNLIEFIRSNVDILFCNKTEATSMAGTENVDDAFEILREMTDTLFLTCEKDGSFAGNSDGNKITIKAFPVNAVDTTGAGDLFAAGALYGLLYNHSLEESAIIGSYCASQVVTHFGARLPADSHTDVNNILSSYKG
jgi:sugar/nucleoside kinase (ribokinase family)